MTTGENQQPLDEQPAKEYELLQIEVTRREIGRHMSESHKSIPASGITMKVAAERLLSRRESLEKSSGRRVSLTAMIVERTAESLLRNKKFNSVYIGDEWRCYSCVHMCVAIQSVKGLVAPIVRNAHLKNVFQITDEIDDLQKKADGGRLGIQDVTGGTFTITNLGPQGVLIFDPIINAPQVAILAIGTTLQELALQEGKVVPRNVFHMTLAYDHRLVDGYDASVFLRELRTNLNHENVELRGG